MTDAEAAEDAARGEELPGITLHVEFEDGPGDLIAAGGDIGLRVGAVLDFLSKRLPEAVANQIGSRPRLTRRRR